MWTWGRFVLHPIKTGWQRRIKITFCSTKNAKGKISFQKVTKILKHKKVKTSGVITHTQRLKFCLGGQARAKKINVQFYTLHIWPPFWKLILERKTKNSSKWLDLELIALWMFQFDDFFSWNRLELLKIFH